MFLIDKINLKFSFSAEIDFSNIVLFCYMRYNTIRFCAIIFFFASALPCFGQLTTSNDLGIVREIPIKFFIGKRFKAGMDIKNIPSDSIGLAGFFFLQVGKGDYDFVPGTRQSKPATSLASL